MNNEVDVIAGIGLDQKTRKSHWPARLDFVQSASGLFLGLFMWGHMAFVSTHPDQQGCHVVGHQNVRGPVLLRQEPTPALLPPWSRWFR